MSKPTCLLVLSALVFAGVSTGCNQIDQMMAKSEGERLWLKHCSRCHGIDGSGNTPQYMGNPNADLTDDYWVHGGDRTAIEEVILNGVFGEMPAFDSLSRKDLTELVHYLRELRGERRPR